MKAQFVFLMLWMTSVSIASPAAAQSCGIAVKAEVEVSADVVTLADLLAPGTCPALLREAARMQLGRAPLAGSDRVLDAGTLRALLLKAAAAAGIGFGGKAELPILERTTLRRSAALPRTASHARAQPQAQAIPASALTVRPGELVRLLWDQNGIRSIVPATCLDRGATGDEVRARIQPGGRVVKATVVSADLVQVVL